MYLEFSTFFNVTLFFTTIYVNRSPHIPSNESFKSISFNGPQHQILSMIWIVQLFYFISYFTYKQIVDSRKGIYLRQTLSRLN